MKRLQLFFLLASLVLVLPACSTNQTLATQADDAAITTKVKAKLTADPEINPFNIDVDTDEGIVTLSGTVEDSQARNEAARLARNTGGVLRVINDIKVGDKTIGESVDDARIVASIKAKLTADDSVNPLNVDVDSNQGIVTLSGRVETQIARDAAGRVARETKGVKSVKNRLKVGDERKS
jgi:hyperosmotically inducible protein